MRVAIALFALGWIAMAAWLHHDATVACGDNVQCRVALEAGGPTG